MRKHLADVIKIKASGGIRTFAFAKELIDAGADRIGCSSSIKILQESNNETNNFEDDTNKTNESY